jgi:hypothetical protein
MTKYASPEKISTLARMNDARLTHSMFQNLRLTVAEIIAKYISLEGLGNLTKLRGHFYFNAHASEEFKHSSIDKRH